jgi:macrolide transport system ATP-binding/permease protein
MGKFFRRLQYWIRHRQANADLSEEIELHRAMKQERLEQEGLSREEAAAASRKALGNVLVAREKAQDVWGWRWLDALKQDVRYTARQIGQAPALTVFIMLTLAIPMGAITAALAILNAELFTSQAMTADPPHATQPSDLREIFWHTDFRPGFLMGRGQTYVSHPVYEYLRKNTSSFSSLACFLSTGVNLDIGNDAAAEDADAMFVSGNAFETLGAGMALGRPISPADDRSGAPAVAVVSYSFWQQFLNEDPAALGRVVSVNGLPVVVVGVTPRRFSIDAFSVGSTLMLPVAHYGAVTGEPNVLTTGLSQCRVIGRLREESSEEQARLESELLLRQVSSETNPLGPSFGLLAEPNLMVGLRGVGRRIDGLYWHQVRESLPEILSGLALLATVLFIACANIAGLLLARGAARRGEIAARLTLGASRGRIVRQLLTESVVFAATGGGLGVMICLLFGKLAELSRAEFALTTEILAITAGLTVFIGILFGMMPAWNASRADLQALTKQTSSGALGRSSFRSGKVLVGVQVALSFPLLVAACLHTQILLAVTSPGGWDDAHVLILQLERVGNSRRAAAKDYVESAIRQLEDTPGVVSASSSTHHQNFRGAICLPGRPASNNATRDTAVIRVVPGFFKTLQMPLLRGRDVEWSDLEGGAGGAIVNEAFAKQFFPGGDPLSEEVVVSESRECLGVLPDGMPIVGVVPTWSNSPAAALLDLDLRPAVYLPAELNDPHMTFVLRTEGQASSQIPSVQRAMLDLNPDQPVVQPSTLAERLEVGLRNRRILAGVFGALGFIALLQAVIGIYGTLSYFVNGRTSEIGLRMALGAERAGVIRLVVRQSLVSVAGGILFGLLGVPLITRLMASEWNKAVGEVTLRNQLEIVAVVSLLFVVAFFAASGPAWRASRIDPMSALRNE